MVAFDELMHQRYPVIHSQRSDGVLITAIRVPIDDIRLERWGWILNQSYKTSDNDKTDLDTMYDAIGRPYPRIYSHVDILHYNERWGCLEWEVGYTPSDSSFSSARITTPLPKILLQEQTFRQEIETINQEQIQALQRQLSTTIEQFLKTLDVKYTSIQTILRASQEDDVKIGKGLSSIQTTVEQQNCLIEELKHPIVQGFSELQDYKDALRKDITILTQNTIDQDLKSIKELISSTIVPEQKFLHDVLDEKIVLSQQIEHNLLDVETSTRDQTNFLQTMAQEQGKSIQSASQETKQLFETLSQSLQHNVQTQTEQLNDIQGKLGVIWDTMKPEQDTNTPDNDKNDVSSTAKKVALTSKSRIERITATQMSLGSAYYKDAREQSKRSFGIARLITIFGGITLLCVIVVFITAALLHLLDATVLLVSSIAAIAAAITEGVAAFTLIYDKATKQFTHFHSSLDRIQRSSIAQAICETMEDEQQQQQALMLIVQGLLANDDRWEASLRQDGSVEQQQSKP